MTPVIEAPAVNCARLAKGAAVIGAHADGGVGDSYGRGRLPQAVPSPTAGIAIGTDRTAVEATRADIYKLSWWGLNLTIEVGTPTM